MNHADARISRNGGLVGVGLGKQFLDLLVGFPIHGHGLAPTGGGSGGKLVLESRRGKGSEGPDEVGCTLVFGIDLLVYLFVKGGEIGGSLLLAFPFFYFGFRSFLDVLEDLLGIFVEIYVKGYFCHGYANI